MSSYGKRKEAFKNVPEKRHEHHVGPPQFSWVIALSNFKIFTCGASFPSVITCLSRNDSHPFTAFRLPGSSLPH